MKDFIQVSEQPVTVVRRKKLLTQNNQRTVITNTAAVLRYNSPVSGINCFRVVQISTASILDIQKQQQANKPTYSAKAKVTQIMKPLNCCFGGLFVAEVKSISEMSF